MCQINGSQVASAKDCNGECHGRAMWVRQSFVLIADICFTEKRVSGNIHDIKMKLVLRHVSLEKVFYSITKCADKNWRLDD